MRDDAPDPVSPLEQEGIPEMEDPYPGEAATGVRHDELMAPGDRPAGVEEFGVTAAEERLDEPLAVRVLREEPDAGDGGDLADAGVVAGRLVAPDDGLVGDDEADVVAGEAAADVGALSAEESAMYVTAEDEAPGLSWDASPDYVEDEAPGGGAGAGSG